MRRSDALSVESPHKFLNTRSTVFGSLILSRNHQQQSSLSAFQNQIWKKRQTKRKNLISSADSPCPKIFGRRESWCKSDAADFRSTNQLVNQTFLCVSDTDHGPIGVRVLTGTLHEADPSLTINSGSNPFFVWMRHIKQLKIVGGYFWDAIFPLVGIMLRTVFSEVKRASIKTISNDALSNRLLRGSIGFPCSATFSGTGVAAFSVNHPGTDLIFNPANRTWPQTRLKKFGDLHGGNIN